ncbi:small serum protein 1-like [Anolis carolinensis]|uniref:small serum protein 1-like n=1 Tax=Anolis carolinensis TaxID=28377 RepID=UPI002F2B8D9E
MNALFGLVTLSISLSWCNGYCVTHAKTGHVHLDRPRPSHGCADPHNGESHEMGTVWNSAKCMRCECGEYEVECCLRFLPYIIFPGCSGFLDLEKCHYNLKLGDRSKPCPVHLLKRRK